MIVEKKVEIDDYLNEMGSNAVHSSQNLLIKGEVDVYPVYELPIELLCLNTYNGRFAAEKREKERELGHELDPNNPEHEIILLDLLLPQNDPKSTELIADIREIGQIDPGVITSDGILINGNRRYATLKILNAQDPSGKFAMMLVHRISNLPPKEIYKLEVMMQIKDPLQVKYHPINDLLKIKEGLRFYNQEELANILGWKVRKIKVYKNRLGLIDDFLRSINSEGYYHLLVNLFIA